MTGILGLILAALTYLICRITVNKYYPGRTLKGLTAMNVIFAVFAAIALIVVVGLFLGRGNTQQLVALMTNMLLLAWVPVVGAVVFTYGAVKRKKAVKKE